MNLKREHLKGFLLAKYFKPRWRIGSYGAFVDLSYAHSGKISQCSFETILVIDVQPPLNGKPKYYVGSSVERPGIVKFSEVGISFFNRDVIVVSTKLLDDLECGEGVANLPDYN